MTVAASRRTFLVASLSAGVSALGGSRGIRVGCQANAWPLREGDFDQLLEVVRKMRELGYAGFECNVRYLQRYFVPDAEAPKLLTTSGVQFIGTHMSMPQEMQEEFSK